LNKLGIWAIAIVAAFVVGVLSANPVVEAAGGWKAAIEDLQAQIDAINAQPVALNSIDSSHIVDGTITGADIDSTTTITASQFDFNSPITKSITYSVFEEVGGAKNPRNFSMHTIPDGAKITELECFGIDTSSSSSFTCELVKIQFGGTSGAIFASANSGSAFSGGATTASSGALNEIVNRDSFAYYIFFKGDNVAESENARVTYEISTLE